MHKNSKVRVNYRRKTARENLVSRDFDALCVAASDKIPKIESKKLDSIYKTYERKKALAAKELLVLNERIENNARHRKFLAPSESSGKKGNDTPRRVLHTYEIITKKFVKKARKRHGNQRKRKKGTKITKTWEVTGVKTVTTARSISDIKGDYPKLPGIQITVRLKSEGSWK